jgi:hypothetical protein
MESDVISKFFLVALVAALLSGGCASQQVNTPPQDAAVPVPPPPTVGLVPPAPEAKPAPDATADELIAMLNDTESVDTFLVALEAVKSVAPQHPKLIPLVIKNAERLELLKGMASADKPKKEQEAFKTQLAALLEARKASAAMNVMNVPPPPTLMPARPLPPNQYCPVPTQPAYPQAVPAYATPPYPLQQPTTICPAPSIQAAPPLPPAVPQQAVPPQQAPTTGISYYYQPVTSYRLVPYYPAPSDVMPPLVEAR